jgi:predicted KAP-like P-loop ATPase
MSDESNADLDYGDLPIDTPEQDIFGTNDFVASLARALQGMKSPKGVVLALNGPWGSGKSSAMNLLKHHLKDASDAGSLEILDFNPWWFRGEEALVLAFFRELYTATQPSLGAKAKKLLPKLGARLLKATSLVAPAADAMGAGGGGKVAASVLNWLSGMIEDTESVDKLHGELADALAAQEKRFIVMIDDLDRLSPDEALAMFRLVKSVGRLPNVIYVLAFDRLLAERVVTERFPSEGPHYLEKIVQASFELPPPVETDLQDMILGKIWDIAGVPDERFLVHIMNLFHDILAPDIKTPRDAVRFINAFSITWPAVAGEVDLGDFIALEAYRLFHPGLYQAIRDNRNLLVGAAILHMGRQTISSDQLDQILLASEADKGRFRSGLMRLFPKLASIWQNTYHDGSEWKKQRRACSEIHFPIYFRLSLSAGAVSKREIDDFLTRGGDEEWVLENLRRAAVRLDKNGRSRLPQLLDAWQQHASELPLEKVPALLKAIFSIANELDLDGDAPRGMAIESSNLRIHWLMRSLLIGRTELAERSKIIASAGNRGELSWRVDLAASVWEHYHPREGDEPRAEENQLMTRAQADAFVAGAVKVVESAARDGSLLEHRQLRAILNFWYHLKDDGGASAKAWVSRQLGQDHAVGRFARAFTSHSWGHAVGLGGLGDLVSKRSDRALVNVIGVFFDLDQFRERLKEVATKAGVEESDAQAAIRLLNAWEQAASGGD